MEETKKKSTFLQHGKGNLIFAKYLGSTENQKKIPTKLNINQKVFSYACSSLVYISKDLLNIQPSGKFTIFRMQLRRMKYICVFAEII